jgi:hypothetical protein
MAIGKGPGPKKKVTSKIGTNKEGQTVAAKGYNMALVRKQGEPSTRTKTLTGSPVGTKVTTPVGIYAPQPVAPATKVAVAPAKKVDKRYGKGLTATGKVLRKVKEAVDPGNYSFKLGKGGGGGGKTCAAYSGYPNRRK